MIRFLAFFLGLVLFSCNPNKKEVPVLIETSKVINLDALPEISILNSRELYSTWPTLQLFSQTYEALFKVNNSEDLLLAVENALKSIENLENQQKPEEIGSPGYLSRLDLLKTELFRLKERLSEGQFDSTILEDTVNAYTGLMNYISLQWERNSD
jgi:hypothetical protein